MLRQVVCKILALKNAKKQRTLQPVSRKIKCFEMLEERSMLAIVWGNEFAPNDGNAFAQRYGANEVIARQIVNRAIDDWNAVILDQNFDNDNNPATNSDFMLNVSAADLNGGRGQTNITTVSGNLPGWTPEVPRSANILLDDDGGGFNDSVGGTGDGWFFDNTPTDDAEFTGIANPFQASFIDANTAGNFNDFYRTIVHEIGHALGLYLSTNPLLDTVRNFTTNVGVDQLDASAQLRQFNNPNGQFGVTATLTTNGGGHVYEGPVDANFPNVPIHPHDLMNPGRTVPPPGADPIPTTRQWISDLNVMILADAYGYTVTLPSQLDTAHATLDSLTGTLLVQGRTGGLNDTIALTVVGDNIQVVVNSTTELVPLASVTQIVIAGLGGTDSISVASGLQSLRRDVQYVVSSNEDAIDSGTLGNGLVDLDAIVPGYQVALRAAIHDIGAGTGSIFVPRGNYNLTLTGTGGTTQGDLDITGNVTIVGAGAGATIIDASGITDRLFEVNGASRSLSLSRMTITGGLAPGTVQNPASTGGAVNVANGGALELEQVAVVGNQASGQGGGVYIGPGSSATVQLSVFTDNTAGTFGGGLIASGTNAAITVGSSIFAKNTAVTARVDFRAANGATANDEGNNLIGVWDNDQTELTATPANGNLLGGTPDYIVTSIVDSYDANRATDLVERSLREAVDRANQDDAQTNLTAEEIWLPAWKFVLTRDRGTNLTDTDTGYGDLDIIDSLKVRGVTGFTSVEWRPGVVDAIFDLLGDFDGTGLVGDPDGGSVNGRDFLRWQQQAGQGTRYQDYEVYSADANDDGHVDSADNDIRALNYGNTLEILPSVNVILA